ncbi:hypothetical protein ACINWC487_A0117 [Acinetobacter nosocomialis]|nr:hypothetical protein ACINWC487_A0117 [Acinetobacter nosocomialis]
MALISNSRRSKMATAPWPTSEQMLTIGRYPGDMAQSAFTARQRPHAPPVAPSRCSKVTEPRLGRKRSRSNRPSCWSSISGRRIVQELSN